MRYKRAMHNLKNKWKKNTLNLKILIAIDKSN